MVKKKTRYVCQSCGQQSPQWLGRCPGCGSWNTFVEEVVQETGKTATVRVSSGKNTPSLLTDVSGNEGKRIDTGIGEFNRVLGGGLVAGSLLLLAGDPGIGKSTLTMQLLSSVQIDGPVLYVSGEESKGQIRNRAERLGTLSARIHLLTENDLQVVDDVVQKLKPGLLIIDSIQTVYDSSLSAAPGSVSQLRQVATLAMNWAKGMGIPTLLIGHVTKDGAVAGPRVLEHMVDAVLYFEGDRQSQYRLLRAFKNRFGSTNEIGLFDMASNGLIEVKNPSAAFLAERPESTPGSAVTALLEGTRPILVEIQALVAPSLYGQPRRMTNGADYNRIAMLLAVLEKRIGLALGNQDVYLNVVGGLHVDETAADLAIAVAIASAYRDKPLPDDMIFLGEVGLTGELRRVNQLERRLREAENLGFKRAVVPDSCQVKSTQLSIIPLKHLGEAVQYF